MEGTRNRVPPRHHRETRTEQPKIVLDDPIVEETKPTILPFEGPEAPTFLPEQTTIAVPDPFDLTGGSWDLGPEPVAPSPILPFETTPAIHGAGEVVPAPGMPVSSAPLQTTNPVMRYLVQPFGQNVVEPALGVASRMWNVFDRGTDLAEKAAFPFQAADPSAAPPDIINTPKGWNNWKQIFETPLRALADPLSVTREGYGTPILALGNMLAEHVGGDFGQNAYDITKLWLDAKLGRSTEDIVGQPIERLVAHMSMADDLLGTGGEVPQRPESHPTELYDPWAGREAPPRTKLTLDPDESFPVPTLPELVVTGRPPGPLDLSPTIKPEVSPPIEGTMSALPAPPVRPPPRPSPDTSTIAVPESDANPALLPLLLADDEADPARKPSSSTVDAPHDGPHLGGAALGGGVVGGAMALGTDLYRKVVLGEDVSLGEAATNALVGAGTGAASETAEEVVGHAIAVAAGGADLLGRLGGAGLVEAGIAGLTSTVSNGAALERGEVDASHATANVLVDAGVGLGSGLAGAATGAAIGSVIPVGGTLVGAGVGFAGGALASMGVSALAESSGFSDWAKENLGDELAAVETPLDVAWGGINGGIDGAITGAEVGGAAGAAMGALSTGATAAMLGFAVGGPVGALLAGAAGAGIGAVGGGLIGAGLGVVPGAGIGAGIGFADELATVAGVKR